MTGWVHLSYGLHPPTTKHTKRNKTSWLFFRPSVANWCRAISDDRLLLPAPDVIDTSLLWDCCSVQPAQSAEKVCVSQLNSLWHWHTSRLASWMARWYIVWCWSEIFSSLASTANLMLFTCPKFGPLWKLVHSNGWLYASRENCRHVKRCLNKK